MSITIYHNNSCSKSRIALAELTKSGEAFQVINYLETVPTEEELRALLMKLDMNALDLVRKTEKVYLEKFKGEDLSDDEWIKALHENPILIQRPILVKEDVAIIGRSEEALDEFF